MGDRVLMVSWVNNKVKTLGRLYLKSKGGLGRISLGDVYEFES